MVKMCKSPPKDIEFLVSIPDDIWILRGDPTQVLQILLNLSVNARDAMVEGGCLSISAQNCPLDEQYIAMNTLAKPGNYVHISVIDTGIGIPPAIIDKIFEPFFTTKDMNKGTGLGLSTVLAIVKSHEGIVSVDSAIGRGTTFNVYLPAIESRPEVHEKQSQQTSIPHGKGETILVVDDEMTFLTITRQTLESYGYRVVVARDGAEAIAVYVDRQNDISAVITDMMMPTMDGRKLIQILLRMNPATKIISASGLTTNVGGTRFPEPGVKHFLRKPFTADILLKAVRSVLDDT
jgi:CheY-like chemotaxis protein